MKDTVVLRSRNDVIELIGGETLSPRKSAMIIAVALGCTLLDGYDFASLGVGASQIKAEFHLSPLIFGSVTAAIAVGALLGAFIGGYYVDKIGRLKMFILDIFFFVFAALGAAASTNVIGLLVFRFLLGLGIGLDFPVAMSFISEYRSVRSRATSLTLWGIMFSAGVILTYVLALAIHAVGLGQWLWRIVVGFGIVPAIIVLVLRYKYMHESPLWAANEGDLDGAARLLEKIYGIRVTVSPDAETGQRFSEIYSLHNYLRIFAPPYLKRTLLVSMIGITQSMEFFAVSFYLPFIILGLFGKDYVSAISGSMILAGIVPLGTVMAIALLPTQGMRRLVILGYGGVLASLLALGLGYGHVDLAVVTGLIVIFQFAHGFGPGTLGMTMAAMSFPTEIRGAGVGVAQGFLRLGSIFGFYFFPLIYANFGLGSTLLILAIAPAIGLLTCCLTDWDPSNYNVDLEEISAIASQRYQGEIARLGSRDLS